MLEALKRLMGHMQWADAQVLARMREARSAGGAVSLLAHVLAAERLWHLRLQGEDWTSQPVWPELSLAACAALAAENAKTYEAYMPTLDEAALARTVTYTNSKGVTYTNTVGDILLHVAMHGSHHRGQIASMLRRAETEPPAVDYIVFVR
jgi:uncharacterized damage-inducible protein DinB